MKTAKLTTTIRTFFEDGSFRNNVAEIAIPVEAAEILLSAWAAGGSHPLHTSSVAKYLAKNQNADVVLEIDGQPVAGIRGMSAEEGVGDVFTYEGMEDNL